MGRKLTTEEFVKECSEVHGNKYDYSKVDYVNNRIKVLIICPEHGEFWQIPKDHKNGHGCKECGKIATLNCITSSKDIFIEKANLL